MFEAREKGGSEDTNDTSSARNSKEQKPMKDPGSGATHFVKDAGTAEESCQSDA